MHFTKDQIRSAILNTADLIEKHPKKYNFVDGLVPRRAPSNYSACTLAWIGHFLGYKAGTPYDRVALDLGYATTFRFYDKVGRDADDSYKVYVTEGLPEALRAFANREYPA